MVDYKTCVVTGLGSDNDDLVDKMNELVLAGFHFAAVMMGRREVKDLFLRQPFSAWLCIDPRREWISWRDGSLRARYGIENHRLARGTSMIRWRLERLPPVFNFNPPLPYPKAISFDSSIRLIVVNWWRETLLVIIDPEDVYMASRIVSIMNNSIVAEQSVFFLVLPKPALSLILSTL